MVSHPMRLKRGALVVFEGLDRTGKSTQISRFRSASWSDPKPVFTHMPSGTTDLTQAIYRLTEDTVIDSPLARQLLHLACHAENLGPLDTARRERAVVLDRWWWSTVAYGQRAVHEAYGMDEAAFRGLIDTIWSSAEADVVFLFTTPYQRDELNREAVREAYEQLADQYPAITVRVPRAEPDETEAFIIDTLRERSLIST